MPRSPDMKDMKAVIQELATIEGSSLDEQEAQLEGVLNSTVDTDADDSLEDDEESSSIAAVEEKKEDENRQSSSATSPSVFSKNLSPNKGYNGKEEPTEKTETSDASFTEISEVETNASDNNNSNNNVDCSELKSESRTTISSNNEALPPMEIHHGSTSGRPLSPFDEIEEKATNESPELQNNNSKDDDPPSENISSVDPAGSEENPNVMTEGSTDQLSYYSASSTVSAAQRTAEYIGGANNSTTAPVLEISSTLDTESLGNNNNNNNDGMPSDEDDTVLLASKPSISSNGTEGDALPSSNDTGASDQESKCSNDNTESESSEKKRLQDKTPDSHPDDESNTADDNIVGDAQSMQPYSCKDSPETPDPDIPASADNSTVVEDGSISALDTGDKDVENSNDDDDKVNENDEANPIVVSTTSSDGSGDNDATLKAELPIKTDDSTLKEEICQPEVQSPPPKGEAEVQAILSKLDSRSPSPNGKLIPVTETLGEVPGLEKSPSRPPNIETLSCPESPTKIISDGGDSVRSAVTTPLSRKGNIIQVASAPQEIIPIGDIVDTISPMPSKSFESPEANTSLPTVPTLESGKDATDELPQEVALEASAKDLLQKELQARLAKRAYDDVKAVGNINESPIAVPKEATTLSSPPPQPSSNVTNSPPANSDSTSESNTSALSASPPPPITPPAPTEQTASQSPKSIPLQESSPPSSKSPSPPATLVSNQEEKSSPPEQLPVSSPNPKLPSTSPSSQSPSPSSLSPTQHPNQQVKPEPSAPATPSRSVSSDSNSASAPRSINVMASPSSIGSKKFPKSPQIKSSAFKPRSLSQVIRKDLWSSDASTVAQALQWITIEAFHDDDARGKIARAGGLLAIVRCMDQHAGDAVVQKAACQALEKLALNVDNELAISDVGGVEAILNAMMGHLENAAVQEAAWSALQNLTCKNSKSRMSVDTEGGMDALVSAMRDHVNDAKVQLGASGTLANLCLQNEARVSALADTGGFVAMATALELHWSNKEVRKEISRALAFILEDLNR